MLLRVLCSVIVIGTYCKYAVVAAGSPSASVRPQPSSTGSKSIIDAHLELFLDETKRLTQSVVECIKENGVDQSIDEVTTAVLFCVNSINVTFVSSVVSVLQLCTNFSQA